MPLTRATRPLVSPSLELNQPAVRYGRVSPCQLPSEWEFRPVSPSLEIPELQLSPKSSPRSSPSLGLINPDAIGVVPPVIQEEQPRGTYTSPQTKMTQAVCRRASRMARPCEPTERAMARAHQIIHSDEHAMRTKGMEKVSGEDQSKFKLSNASTGKGPAIRAEIIDEEDVAQNQALMNHVSTYHAVPQRSHY